MKKQIIISALLLSAVTLLFACKPNGVNAKSTEIAKSFYTEYLKAKNEEGRAKSREKFMTPILVDELDLRGKQLEADAITGVQDDTGFINKMTVAEGQNDEWAKVTFDLKETEGVPYRIYEANVHFRVVDDTKLMDTLDMIIYDVDQDGDSSQIVYNTKYANKAELTEEEKAEMERMKKYYDDLFAEGFIG